MSRTIALWARMGLFLLAACGIAAFAGPVKDRVQAQGVVKVCIWSDYYGVTWRNPRTQELSGVDIDLAGELGRDLGARVEFVESSFQTLIADLNGDRCDVGMFAIAVIPQRQEHMQFTQPYMRSDIYGITTRSSGVVKQWSDIDKPGVQVAVQAGTFMEPVMAQTLKHATLVSVKPPATRERELTSGRVDVFMTDYPYSRRLLDNADWARLLSPPAPFSPVSYAYALRKGDAQWLAAMETFVARVKQDGRLDRAARKNGLEQIVVR